MLRSGWTITKPPNSTSGAGLTSGIPAEHVVDFKREVYRRALRYFAPLVEAACSVEIVPASCDRP